MDIEKSLQKVKRDYLSITPPFEMSKNGWVDLQERLGDKKKKKSWFILMPRLTGKLAFIILILLFLGIISTSVIKAAMNSLPGGTLHPVKRLSEDVFSSVTGNQQIKVDSRAQEIIELTKEQNDNSETLKKAVDDYKETVSRVKKKMGKSNTEKKEFRSRLKEHEKEFEQAVESTSSTKEVLGRAVEAARDGQDDNDTEDQNQDTDNEQKSQDDKEDGNNTD